MPCFVYVIAHVKDDDVLGLPVKIGVASNPKNRTRTLQTGNPESIRLAASFELPSKSTAHRIERAVRDELDAYNLTGREWFWVDPAAAVATIKRTIRFRLPG
jgi:hypothetical protein